jgi:hypothetical protein
MKKVWIVHTMTFMFKGGMLVLNNAWENLCVEVKL